MKKPTIKEWAKALRSGKYRQYRDGLVEDKRYCCLGVYAKMQGLDDVGIGNIDNGDGGLEEEYAPECKRFSQEDLMNLNDGNEKLGFKKHSFKEIADVLEGKMKPKMVKE